MTLTTDEQSTYVVKFIIALQTLPPGKYFIKDFFGSEPSVPRIAAKFREDVLSGTIPRVSLANKLSREGYIVI